MTFIKLFSTMNRYDFEVTEDLLEGRLDDEVHTLYAQTG